MLGANWDRVPASYIDQVVGLVDHKQSSGASVPVLTPLYT